MEEYPWYVPYKAALFETDARRKASMVHEATSALERRLLSPIEPGSHEAAALGAAKEGLARLKARLRKFFWDDRKNKRRSPL